MLRKKKVSPRQSDHDSSDHLQVLLQQVPRILPQRSSVQQVCWWPGVCAPELSRTALFCAQVLLGWSGMYRYLPVCTGMSNRDYRGNTAGISPVIQEAAEANQQGSSVDNNATTKIWQPRDRP